MLPDVPRPRLGLPSPRRLAVPVVAGALGAGVAYLASWALSSATCASGGCPTATDPLPFMAVLGVVAAWAASSGARG